jgi:hypothetical protein
VELAKGMLFVELVKVEDD